MSAAPLEVCPNCGWSQADAPLAERKNRCGGCGIWIVPGAVQRSDAPDAPPKR